MLGSVQSGKTFIITLAGLIEYAQKLNEYDGETNYYGAVVGWDLDTLKGNIINVLEMQLDLLHLQKDKDYELKFGGNDKYFKIYNMTYFFFGFNTKLSFNKILGRPLIFEWVDEAARIYGNLQLQQSFDELPGRQSSFAGHPYKKRIDSFNVEGNSHHPYKERYIDNTDAIKFIFYPYDNPKIDTKTKYEEFIKTYPEGSLREQKIFNRWVVAEGKVFNKINKIKNLENLTITQIGIGVDYGNVNPTTFVPIALCFDTSENRWKVVRLGIYYHNSGEDNNKPTTAWYVEQEKAFIKYLNTIYTNIPVTDNVVDSEAIHYTNALYNAGVDYILANKGAGSVDGGVQQMQSLFYKDVLYTLETPSIDHFQGNIPIFNEDDIGTIELESYQYDNVKSIKTGQNCYVKELDHSIDAERYLIQEWQRQGKILII